MALTRVDWVLTFLVLALAVSKVVGQTSIALPRWGQASTILYDKLLVSGGKIDPQHQFTYTSAPNCNDLLSLDLSTSFALSSPPWSYISGSQNSSSSQGPAVAFHTLTPYTSSNLLLFGGDGGFNAIQSNADSVWLLNVGDLMFSSWSPQTAGWASEPIRRVYHAAPSASGAIYILGGQKADGSQIGFPDSYIFNAVADNGSPNFIPLTSTTSVPPGLYGHAAHILPGGTLLVFGGFFSSASTPDTPSPLSTIYTLNTTSASPAWTIQNATGGTIPVPRRGFASALLNNGKILIHGGADAAIQTLYSDAAILDTTQTPMTWSSINGLSDTLGRRVGHFAVPIHNQILFGFGWAGDAAASATLVLYDPTSGKFQPTYTPSPSPVSITTLPVSPTSPGGSYPSTGANTGKGGSGAYGSPTLSGAGLSPSGSGSEQAGSGGPGQIDGSKMQQSNKTGIVVGSVLGFFAFVGLVGGGVYYVLKQRERRTRRIDSSFPNNFESRWSLMPEEDPWDATLNESHTNLGTTVQMAGTRWHDPPRSGWGIPALGALIGIGGIHHTTRRSRLDMLADEDVQQLDIDSLFHVGEDLSRNYPNDKSRPGKRRQGTGGSSVSTERRTVDMGRSSWYNIWNSSVTSLRNVGIAFGVTAEATAAHNGIAGSNMNHSKWGEEDERSLDPFKDPAPGGSVPNDVNPLLDTDNEPCLKDGESTSSPITIPVPNVNPFADPHEGEGHIGDVRAVDTTSLLGNIHDERTTGKLGGGESSQTSLTRSFAMVEIARAGIESSGFLDRDRGTSVESHNAPSSEATQSSSFTGTGVASSFTDPSSHKIPLLSPRTTSIVGATKMPSLPMRRSDSWWSRFSRTSFLDRHSVHELPRNASNGGLVDFRDPNPLPRLGAILESTAPSRQTTEDPNIPSTCMVEGGAGKVEARQSGYTPSTKSSIKTANSELIEGMEGTVEVVQRAVSLTSRGTASPLTSECQDHLHRWGSSSIEADSFDDTHRHSWTMSDGDPEMVVSESPTIYLAYGSPRIGVSQPLPSDLSNSGTRTGEHPRYRPLRRAMTGAVAARVSAYERRLSQDSLTQSPPSDTKSRLKDERSRRGGVGYGLVPKAALFVANPDRRNPSGST